MRLVILESPFAGESDAIISRNIKYARACVRDSLLRGEAPIASHLLYTQEGILDDTIPLERQHGIDSGLAWKEVAHASVVYVDFGISKGMQYGIDAAKSKGIPVELREILNQKECPICFSADKYEEFKHHNTCFKCSHIFFIDSDGMFTAVSMKTGQ